MVMFVFKGSERGESRFGGKAATQFCALSEKCYKK